MFATAACTSSSDGYFSSSAKMPVAKKWLSLRGFVALAIPLQKNRFML
jgi:hypothetical protein